MLVWFGVVSLAIDTVVELDWSLLIVWKLRSACSTHTKGIDFDVKQKRKKDDYELERMHACS